MRPRSSVGSSERGGRGAFLRAERGEAEGPAGGVEGDADPGALASSPEKPTIAPEGSRQILVAAPSGRRSLRSPRSGSRSSLVVAPVGR